MDRRKCSFTLPSEQFESLLQTGDWKQRDIPRNEWDGLPHGMVDEAVALIISGTFVQDDLKKLNGIAGAAGGMDFLRYESKPRTGEKEGNAYHIVFVKRGDLYEAYSFNNETAIGHHFDYKDLEKYF